ncbi:ADQ_G0021400.mRNA.1.CDS.1 [Saccharomyces cerevisiae]|nr:ADQ_G0021400.mRNA.1.CDS.1 [Saccharomyces cerevisiae]CAI6684840.1 ADQ_G0021400.mRNA.1.CDS.1 [Saccharomyces cerevisiae]
MSDQESVVSFNSQNTSMVDVEGQQPQQYVPSKTNSRANQLKLTKTETVKSLQDLGVTSAAPVPDINAPQTAKNNIFPEEYTMETPSGLVPVATLQSMGRTASALSRTRTKQLNRTATNSSSTGKEEMEEEETEEREDQSGENELDPEIEFVTFVTGDPENPHNWPSWVRWGYTVLLSILVICVAYGSACISGGLGTVEKKFHVGMEAAILSCSLMVIGFSLGPLIWSPVSDLYGRRVAYFVSMGLMSSSISLAPSSTI